MRVAFLGLGLIGGSVACALRARAADPAAPPDLWISAWTPSGTGPAAAAAAGMIDLAATTPRAAIAGADLVVLAAPVPDCLAMLDDVAGGWRGALARDAVVTDVASTKTALVSRATALGVRFVGGHPMAGRDASGFAAAEADLFVDRPWVVVPSADEPAVERVEALARAAGARPVRMDADAHDAAVAAISHLPLVVAAALVESVAGGPGGSRPDWPVAASLAATGWRDTTRLARGEIAMGAGIVATNHAAIAARVRAFVTVLESWLAELERDGGPDADVVADRLRVARERLEGMAR